MYKNNAAKDWADEKNGLSIAMIPTILMSWFKTKKQLSSGMAEGINVKVKLTTRKAYGFITCYTVEIALYHALGALPEMKKPPANFSDGVIIL